MKKRDIYILILLVVIGFVGGYFGRLYWKSPPKPLIHEPQNADDMVHIVIQE